MLSKDKQCYTWIPGKGIPDKVIEQLNEIGATKEEFINTLRNLDSVDMNGNLKENLSIDQLSDKAIGELRKKHSVRGD